MTCTGSIGNEQNKTVQEGLSGTLISKQTVGGLRMTPDYILGFRVLKPDEGGLG